MNVLTGELEGLLILEPRVFEDDRGYFTETYQRVRYEAAGLPPVFLQDNLSRSVRGVLRGLHYQVEHPQGKLIGVVRGEIWANVWQTDRIARINPVTGRVKGWIDLTDLLRPEARGPEGDVLNGIAWDRASDRIFVTGKKWPWLFQIEIVPV